MSISKETVDYVAHLARLELTKEELEKISTQLKGVLDFIDKLKNADIKDVCATSHILDLKNILREDVPHASLEIDKTLLNAPSSEKNCFTVPKVIE